MKLIFKRFLIIMGNLSFLAVFVIYFTLSKSSDKIAIFMGGIVIGSFSGLTLIFVWFVMILSIKQLKAIKNKPGEVKNNKNEPNKIAKYDYIFIIFSTIYFYILLILIPLWIVGLFLIPNPSNVYDWTLIIFASIIILLITLFIIWWLIKDHKSFKRMLIFNIYKPNKD